ncbi:hypothetical protein CI109_104163 [Kwoniella shandongensis]|uniref:Uncharacterized protein n=1 Tax=Kwoniella shandongensis TaxID=1734106 RepID=A0A5M6C0U9_9TREE|nr:uncharacterized protein CI109_002924 [Kwoniella shandongensis]KAA5528766.1 hypothetical protein CI109_002924 [Kwoniella shandongensis]
MPCSVAQGIKRLRLDIEGARKVLTAEPGCIGHNWSILTSFLSRLTSLEELVIARVPPICLHGGPSHYTEHLQTPNHVFLPRLSALSVETVDPPRTNHNLDQISERWSKMNNEAELPIETLFVRITVGDRREEIDILDVISSSFPNIRHLSITSYDILHEEDEDNEDPWPRMIGQIIHFISGTALWIPPNSGHFTTMEEFSRRLAPMSYLAVIDIPILFLYREHRPQQLVERRSTPRTHASASALRTWQHSSKFRQYEDGMRKAMSEAAQVLVNTVPTLTSGNFWEPVKFEYTSEHRWEAIEWHIWLWRLDGDAQPMIAVNETPRIVTHDFVTNHDGMIDCSG